MAGRPARGDATAMRVLDVAERLVQVRGFNGFSYADVAAELGITKAALHYHFASKAALGEALIDRYCDRLAASLAALAAADLSAAARLRGYAALYRDGLRGERLCLGGMLAAEYQTLPPAMRSAVIRFFTRNEAWLAGVLADGAAAGEIQLAGAGRGRRGGPDRRPGGRHAGDPAVRRRGPVRCRHRPAPGRPDRAAGPRP